MASGRHVRPCERCGKQFVPKRPDRGTGRWCSQDCARSKGTARERFDQHVPLRESGTCWLWQGYRHDCGYGLLSIKKRNFYAHRIAWEMFRGPIPDGMHVLHRCDVPACVNPEHLFLGTNDDNIADKVSKGRQPRGETQGSSVLTDSDVKAIRSSQESSRLLAERFRVSQSNIYQVRTGRTWAHITEAR